jgi:hypothetical protein
MPAPLSATVWGLPKALSVNARDAVRAPVAPGVKTTDTTQEADSLRVARQLLLVMAKSEAFAPVTATLSEVKEALPIFVSFTLAVAPG